MLHSRFALHARIQWAMLGGCDQEEGEIECSWDLEESAIRQAEHEHVGREHVGHVLARERACARESGGERARERERARQRARERERARDRDIQREREREKQRESMAREKTAWGLPFFL